MPSLEDVTEESRRLESGSGGKKPENSLWQNMFYLLKNIYRTDKLYLAFIVLIVPVQIGIIALEAYVPKAVIGGIDVAESLRVYLLSIVYPVLLYLAAKCLYVILDYKLVKGGANQRALYMTYGFNKSIDMDYQDFSSEKGQTLVSRGLALADEGDSTLLVTFGQRCSAFLAGIVGIVFFAGLVAQIHPSLLVCICVSGVIQYYYGERLAEFKEKTVKETRGLRTKMRYVRRTKGDYEYAKDIRLYRMADLFRDTERKLEGEWEYYRRKERIRDYAEFALTALLIFFRDGLTYFYLTSMFLSGSIQTADFVFLLGITRGISGWLMDLISQITAIHGDMAPLNDMREYLEYQDSLKRDEGLPVPTRYDIEFKDVWFKYPGSDNWVIKGMSFHIKEGEKVAIVGVNGAGKSTIVGLIIGLLHPCKGEILIGGVNAEEMNINERYALFSAVFQDVHIFPDTVANMVMGSDYTELDLMDVGSSGSDSEKVQTPDEAYRRRKVEEAMEKAGLIETIRALPYGMDTYLGKMSREGAVDLSGGQNQRLVLARAIYRDAPIAILDEPTAALDPIAESEIYERYNQLVKGKTAIFISHRLASTRFCDRIFFIEDGQIIEEGSHEELMRYGGKYKEMFDIQAYYYQDHLEGDKLSVLSKDGGESL